jgi:hypothetical protein
MFANFRTMFLGAAVFGAGLVGMVSSPANAAAADDEATQVAVLPAIYLDAEAGPLWIVYWWKAGDQVSSVNRASHNCGHGPLGKAYAYQLQRELIHAGYNAVVVPENGE